MKAIIAIVTTVSIMDERGDKIQVIVNNCKQILIVEANRSAGFRPLTILTPTDARALARLILDASGLAEQEEEENKTIFCP